jgi:glycosyltransferase involved in cell wall biosynthesis
MTVKKPKLALVSTYKIECGIAVYAECIRIQLEKHFEVTVFPLPSGYFRANDKYSFQIAEKMINDMCEKLSGFDVVNLQLEPGIFGPTPKIILKRLKKLINASQKVIITLHTFLYKTSNSISIIKSIIKRPHTILGILAYERWTNFYSKLFDFLKKTKSDSYCLITHTQREAKNIMLMFGLKNVVDIPLSWLSQEDINTITQSNTRAELIKNYQLQDDTILIGIFGFIATYKGIETAINAMKLLPLNYRLLVFGTVHPNSIQAQKEQAQKEIDKYTAYLLKLTEQINISEDKIIFCGKTTDEEFPRAMNACDFIVLPYLEIGQTSSGPLAIALALKKKILTTNNKFFNEVAKYAKHCFLQFDIGNHIQLAQQIKYSFQNETINKALNTYNAEFNLEKRAIIYQQCWEKMSKITPEIY